jgi:AcrR family transcriptional regulator
MRIFHVTLCYMKYAPKRRPYEQTARAASTKDTQESILTAFRRLLNDRWFDEITLDDVADRAQTTRQTVIRHYGGKSGLLAAFTERVAVEIKNRRAAAPSDDIAGAIAVLVEDYEETGDMVLRLLSLEGRIAEVDPTLKIGRLEHKRWVESTFKPWLARSSGRQRDDRLAQLLVVTDVWTWLLLRRHQQRTAEETARLMAAMATKILKS